MSEPSTPPVKWYRRRRWQIGGAVLLILAIGNGIGSASAHPKVRTVAGPTVQVTTTATATKNMPVPGETATVTATVVKTSTLPAPPPVTVTEPPPPPAVAFAGDGTFVVGSDVQPGTYKSDGGSGCYWGREDSAGKTIDNNIGDGPSVVTIQPGDFAIRTARCAPFHKA